MKVVAQAHAVFNFALTNAMVPRGYILAYFLGNDGTVTSDEINIDVIGSPFRNNVNILYTIFYNISSNVWSEVTIVNIL